MIDGQYSPCCNVTQYIEISSSDAMKGTENGTGQELPLTNGDSSHDNGEEEEEEEELQKEVERLQEENKILKKKQLRDKIELLRRENCRLRAQIEADEAAATNEPSSSTNGTDKIAIVPLGDEMKSQSFIFTSSNGGTLYIKPLDLSTNDLEKMSLDGIIDSIGDMDNSYTYAMGGWSKPINLTSLYNREKHTQTNGSQTPPHYEYMSPQPYHVTPPHSSSKNKKNSSNFPPLNKCGTITTQEDLEARRFVQEFKARRVAHKLTQSDIGDRLNRCTGARYGQSYISRLESMQLSTAIVLRMKPLLNRLLDETENGMFVDGLENMELYHPPTRKKSKSNSGGSKSRKSNSSARNTTNYRQEIDGQAAHHNKTSYQRSSSVPAGASAPNSWNYQIPHHHNLAQPPTTYQEQGNNFFISGVLSSLNPGVMTSRSDNSSCKVSDPMEVALSHSQLYNPYRMPDMVEPKHEVIELSPVQPRPPHPSPAGLVPGDENLRHHDNMHRSVQQHHDNMHHQLPPVTHHSSFSPNLHELTPTIKTEPQITTLHPPQLKPG